MLCSPSSSYYNRLECYFFVFAGDQVIKGQESWRENLTAEHFTSHDRFQLWLQFQRFLGSHFLFKFPTNSVTRSWNGKHPSKSNGYVNANVTQDTFLWMKHLLKKYRAQHDHRSKFWLHLEDPWPEEHVSRACLKSMSQEHVSKACLKSMSHRQVFQH